MLVRLQKILSSRGVASRRAAEELLRDGRVWVNGAVAALGQSADPDADEIAVDGRPLPPPKDKLYIMLYKPRGCVTTMSDTHGRPTVAGLVSDAGCRLYPVGRLDMDSEGLLLMTNDGDAAFRLTHPSHEIMKTYLVDVSGTDIRGAVIKMPSITSVDGADVRPAIVRTLEAGMGRGRLSVIIGEGRKRQVRRLCEMCGLKVTRLVRVSVGELHIGDLPPGKWRRLDEKEVQYLHSIQKCRDRIK